jgi:signal transduction histidine kinase/DNA-binding response OmpR family regulator/PAS domain-containing protein
MNDPAALAVLQVLSNLASPAFFSDLKLMAIVGIRMASFSIEHGNGDASAGGYLACGEIIGSGVGNYLEGYQLGKLACDLVDKQDAKVSRARIYIAFGGQVSLWREHLRLGRRWIERGFNAAREVGDIEYASYYWIQLLTNSLALGLPLEQAQQEAEQGIDYTGKAHFPMVQFSLTGQYRFILTMRGKTPDLGSYNNTDFDETTFEARLTEDASMAITTCFYRIRKLQARFFAHDYAGAVALSEAIERVLWTSQTFAVFAEHHYYSALSKAALYDHSSPETGQQLLEAIADHHTKLEHIADNSPENFTHSAALVKAEIARIEKRDLEAMQLYEQAIASAHENEFVHNEAVAYETAAAFYRHRGFEDFFRTYLTKARNCYIRWGAEGKVQQLERLHPWLTQSQPPQAATLSQQVDAVSIARAQQAISGEIHLDRLAQTLLRIVMESAGAQKGFLSVEGASRLSAEIQPGNDNSQQIVFDTSPRDENIPGTVINYVRHSRETVILDDASAHTGEFSEDDYLRRAKPKSVLCMAIQRQDKLLGVLYLENNLIAGAFTPEYRAVLEVLAAQAAISLETAGVYENLRLNELRFRLGQTAAQIGTWEYNLKSTRFWGSDEAKRIYGFDVDSLDFSTETVEACIPDRERVHQALPDLIEKGIPYNLEFEIQPVDGSAPKFISSIAELYRNPQGTPTKVVGVIQDITERRQAEESNAWNLSINQALSSLYIPLVTTGTSIEQIAEVVLEKSRQLTGSAHGYVAEIDPKNGDLIAHTHTKMIENECTIVEEELRKIRFPRRADGLYNALWGHALNTKVPFYDNAPTKHPASVGIPEGHISIERFLTVPVLLAGELVGQIALSNASRDYTDRDLGAINRIAEFYALAIQHKRAEEELMAHRDHLEELVKQRAAELTVARDVAEEARRLAEDANQAKSTFLANISHELRTPLNAILGYSQLMQRDASLASEQQDYLNTINRSGEHLLGLINDVLEISKIEAGQITLDVATFDLWALLDDMEDLFRVRTDAKGLRLDFVGTNEVPRYLETDEFKLRQILINVLGNAVKFTKRGSVTLRISVKSMDHEAACKDAKNTANRILSHKPREQYLCFEVEDTGVGIAEEELDIVFAAFEQTESGRMSKTGTGLGMAITQKYVRMMGGDITVVSTPGKGSIFRFEISVSEGCRTDIKEQTIVQRRVIGLEPGQDVPRILVVEDMEESRAMLVRLLRIVGIHVQEAVNGKQAIEIFQQWQPNFIWMDIRMPVMDGLEATRYIKETDAGKTTIVAALTAHALEEERKQILAAGCDDVVRKPLRERDIFDVMQKHLGLKYVYEVAEEETVSVRPKVRIGPEQLAALPADLLSQLHQAALELNEEQSLALIEKIKPIDAYIAGELDELVRNFAFDILQELTKRSEQFTSGDPRD